MRRASLRGVVLGALLGASAAPAEASVFDIFGFDGRGAALVNAQSAVADDYTAAFYNPARLARRKRIVAGAGFLVGIPQLSVERAVPRDPASDPAESPPDAPPESFSGLTFGMLLPLGAAIDDRLAIGFGAYVPTAQIARGEVLDGRQPQFYRYQNLPDKFVVAAGVAVEPVDWIAVGGGVQVLAGLTGGLQLDLSIADQAVRDQALRVDVALTAAATAGINLRPLDQLDIGLSWRQAISLDYALPSAIYIEEVIDVAIDLEGTVLYTPESFNFAVAWTEPSIDLLLSFELSYVRWSAVPDPTMTLAFDFGGDTLTALGLDERIDLVSGSGVDLGFEDVAVWRVGGEYRVDESLVIRGGYAWRPSPAPVPTGVYNYLDGDAHVLGTGIGLSFNNPIDSEGNPAHLDLSWQGTVVPELEVQKTSPTDPVGDYRAGGLVHALSISFRHDL